MKTPAEFVAATCELSTPYDMFLGLYQATHGDPCTTGCAYFRSGQCPAFRSLFPEKAATLKPPAMKKPRESAGYVAPTKRPFRW